jgi:hypothetical protein
VGHIQPKRDIRQGDPLSPYLFIICAEALSGLLLQVERSGSLTGVLTSKNGPRISHLFFADDSLLFCKANSVEWRRLMKILEKYEVASGQKLNPSKTSIFFSCNTSTLKRQEITLLSGLQATDRYDKYLGLPALVGKSRMKAFQSIKDRVWQRLQNWKNKFLSKAGNEILLKAVIQAIPTYIMSVFQLPITLCKEINKMMQKFWWGHQQNSSKIHWMSWERMGFSKNQGGMEFRDLVLFNQALLAKQIWRLIEDPSSLVARIMKAKYHPQCSVMEAPLGRKPSFAWRSIVSAQPVIKNRLVWRVGNGRDINIWGEKWLPIPTTFAVQTPRRFMVEQARVVELIDPITKSWNLTLIRVVFQEDEAKIISTIPLSPLQPKDQLIWRGTKNGKFTVRGAYCLAVEKQGQSRGESSGTSSM